MTEFDRLAHLAWLTDDRSGLAIVAAAEQQHLEDLDDVLAPIEEDLEKTRAELETLRAATGVRTLIDAERAICDDTLRGCMTEAALALLQLAQALLSEDCRSKAQRQNLAAFITRSMVPTLEAARSLEGASQARLALQRRLYPN